MKPTGYQIAVFASLFAVVGLGLFATSSRYFQSAFLPSVLEVADTTKVTTLEDRNLGLTFQYLKGPSGLSIRREDDASKKIVLYKQADRPAMTAALGAAVEGPVTISVSVASNPKKLSPKNWISAVTTPEYAKRTSDVKEISIPVGTAASFSWADLYDGETTVVSHKDSMYVVSVTYSHEEDSIRDAYAEVLATLAFLD